MQRKFTVTLTGLSALLMHWDNIEWSDAIGEARTRIKENDKAEFAAGDDRCPPETWKGYVYNDGEHVCIPTDNLRSCLMKAGAKVTLKNQETFKKATQSGIVFTDAYAKFAVSGKSIKMSAIERISGKFSEHLVAAKALGFKLLAKRAKVNAAKHIRVRPMFAPGWQIIAGFVVGDDRISADILSKIWDYAGDLIGIGDWRPDSPKSPGPYGRFSAKLSAA